MRILVHGAGAVGGYFGGRLARAGHSVAFVARGAHLDALRRDGLRVDSIAGDFTVRRVNISVDYGASWRPAQLQQPKNPYDWQRWTASVRLPSEGYYELWTRATDSRGTMQPHIAGNWNPQGYGANPLHRVAVRIA